MCVQAGQFPLLSEWFHTGWNGLTLMVLPQGVLNQDTGRGKQRRTRRKRETEKERRRGVGKSS